VASAWCSTCQRSTSTMVRASSGSAAGLSGGGSSRGRPRGSAGCAVSTAFASAPAVVARTSVSAGSSTPNSRSTRVSSSTRPRLSRPRSRSSALSPDTRSVGRSAGCASTANVFASWKTRASISPEGTAARSVVEAAFTPTQGASRSPGRHLVEMAAPNRRPRAAVAGGAPRQRKECPAANRWAMGGALVRRGGGVGVARVGGLVTMRAALRGGTRPSAAHKSPSS